MVAQLIERFTGPRTKIPVREYGTLLLKYLRQQKGIVALASTFILTNIGLQLVNPQIMRYFIDEAVAGSPLGTLVTAAVLFVAVALVQQVIGVLATYTSGQVGGTPRMPCVPTSRAMRCCLTCPFTTATRRER